MNESLGAVSSVAEPWFDVEKKWIWGQEELTNRL